MSWADPAWIAPTIVAAIGGAVAIWKSAQGASRARAFAEGQALELARHQKDATKALHERLDRMERRANRLYEAGLASGLIKPTMTGIREVDEG